MQNYEVIILPLAEQDITHNVDYIYFEKKAPDTAIRLLHGFKNRIEGLYYMPEKHALDEDEELAQLGIHKCYYKNYKIFFYIQQEDKKVYVLRVLHMLVDTKSIYFI